MSKFEVWGKVVGSKYLGEYEAESKEQAIELAVRKEGSVSLCWRCSSQVEDPEIDEIRADEVPGVTL